ncbi:MAG TPA: helix-turn-helix transcriptional regulator [Vicinamibacterales bacterium]
MASPKLLARPTLLRFSDRVQELRCERGLTQCELGKLAYMTEEFIYRIERGTENPSLESIALIALALNCDIRDLLLPE